MRSSDIAAGNAYARRGVHTSQLLPGAGGLASFAHNGEAAERLTELVLIEAMLADPLQNILFDSRLPSSSCESRGSPKSRIPYADGPCGRALQRRSKYAGKMARNRFVPSHGNRHNLHFRIALNGLDELFHDRRKGQTVRAGVGEEVVNDDRFFGKLREEDGILDVVFAENGIRSGCEKRTGKAGRTNGGGRRNQESAKKSWSIVLVSYENLVGLMHDGTLNTVVGQGLSNFFGGRFVVRRGRGERDRHACRLRDGTRFERRCL